MCGCPIPLTSLSKTTRWVGDADWTADVLFVIANLKQDIVLRDISAGMSIVGSSALCARYGTQSDACFSILI